MTKSEHGSLVVVGSGIKSIAHITTETRNTIKQADKVLYILADYLTKQWIVQQNPTAEDMHRFYANDKPREQSYQEMIAYSLQFVQQGLHVCVVYYGHPGVFCTPGHESVRQARAGGYQAEMLPGISAEDCLFSDLLLDPVRGCQSFEATDFLVYHRQFDPRCLLILWQIGVTGHLDFQRNGYQHRRGVEVLTQYLQQFYPASHVVTVYEAATYNVCEPVIQHVALGDLPEAQISSVSTLLVPAYVSPDYKGADLAMVHALGIDSQYIKFKTLAELEA